MKINPTQILKNYKGGDIKSIEDGKNSLLTARLAINLALNGAIIKENGLASPITPKDKGRIYQLSTKLWGTEKAVDFTPEQIVFIKQRAREVSQITPLILGRINELFSEEEKEPIVEKEVEQPPKPKQETNTV